MEKTKSLFAFFLVVTLILTTLNAVGNNISQEEKEKSCMNEIVIYAGDLEVYAEQGGYSRTFVIPYYNYNTIVGPDGAEVKIIADYIMDCRHYMDVGYVEISIVGTDKVASAQTGEYQSGTLNITHFFMPGEHFAVKLYAKYCWWYGWQFIQDATDYSFGSTIPGYEYPELEMTPITHEFGVQNVGEYSEPVIFTLKNIGTTTAVGFVYIDGSSDFYIYSGAGEFGLEPEATKEILVVFKPTSGTFKSAALIAYGDNCNPVGSGLYGEGKKSISRNLDFTFLRLISANFPNAFPILRSLARL